MKKLFFLSVAFFMYVYSYAQFTVSGKVCDNENNVIVMANVLLKNTFTGTTTNVNGEFTLKNVKPGAYNLQVSFIGYESDVQKIEVHKDLTNLSFKLKKSAYIADEIVVQATRNDKTMSGSRTEISKDEIKENNPVQDVPFLLNLTPSVVTTSDAGTGTGYTGISIRGSDVRRINVTVNDVPLNDAESHGVWWVDLPDIMASTDNIQIQRGVGSSTNGAGAFGASVNMQTLTLNKDPLAEFNSSYGTYNTSRLMLNTSTGLIKDHFTVDLRLSKIYSDGYIDRAFSDLRSYYFAAGYYAKSTMIKFINFSGSEKTYQAWYGVPKDSLATHRTYNPYSYDNQTDNYWQSNYQLHITHEFSSKLNTHIALHCTKGIGYYENYDAANGYSAYGLTAPIIGTDTISTSNFINRKWLDNDFYGVVSSLNYHQQKLSASVGLSWNRYEGKHYGDVIWAQVVPYDGTSYRWYNGTGNKQDANIFAKINYHLIDKVSLYGDVQARYIDYSIGGIDENLKDNTQQHTYTFFNPKAGACYIVDNHQTVFASFAVAQREPERSNFTDADSGKVPRPEKLFDYELAYQLKTNTLFFGLDLFYMNYKDQLVMTGESNSVGTPIMTNVAGSFRRGIELEVAIKPTSNFQWEANITLSQNRIKRFIAYFDDWDTNVQHTDTFTNSTISFSPGIVFSNLFTFEPVNGFFVKLQSKYVGKQYLDNTQNKDNIIEPYVVHNLTFEYTLKPKWIKELGLQFAINNLLNVKYVNNGWAYSYYSSQKFMTDLAYFPQATRNFMGTLILKF